MKRLRADKKKFAPVTIFGEYRQGTLFRGLQKKLCISETIFANACFHIAYCGV